MKQLSTDEFIFVASLREDMLIKLNYEPDNIYNFVYRIGRITHVSNHPYVIYYGGIALVKWLVDKTKDQLTGKDWITGSGLSLDYLFPDDIPMVQIMTDKDLPELALLSLAVS